MRTIGIKKWVKIYRYDQPSGNRETSPLRFIQALRETISVLIQEGACEMISELTISLTR